MLRAKYTPVMAVVEQHQQRGSRDDTLDRIVAQVDHEWTKTKAETIVSSAKKSVPAASKRKNCDDNTSP